MVQCGGAFFAEAGFCVPIGKTVKVTGGNGSETAIREGDSFDGNECSESVPHCKMRLVLSR